MVRERAGLNRSVDGDIVAVELLPKEQWCAPSQIVLQDEIEEDTGDVLEDEKMLESTSKVEKEKVPTGLVVGIIRRKWRQYCGIIQPPLNNEVNYFLYDTFLHFPYELEDFFVLTIHM